VTAFGAELPMQLQANYAGSCPKEAVPGIGETAPDARLATRRGAASSSTSATSAIRIELAQRNAAERGL